MGNGNRRLDRGETAGIRLTLRANAGSVAELVGELRSASPYLSVLEPYSYFGNLTAGDSANGQFVLSVSGMAPIEDPIWCLLYLTGRGMRETLDIPVIVGDSVNEPLGPDNYGYLAFDNGDLNYPEHPTYEWVDIRNVGTRLILNDDETQTINLPDQFGPVYYYGQRTTKLSICSNGWIAPDTSTRVDYNNITLPDVLAPQRIIALNWDNLDPSPYGWIGYYHDTVNHRFIVTFDSVPYFPRYVAWERFQVIFYDTTLSGPTGDNVFVVQYATAHNIGSVGVGIQNHERNSGLTYVHNLGYPRQAAPIEPGRAIKYIAYPTTALSEPKWFEINRCSRSVSPNIILQRSNSISGNIHVSWFAKMPGKHVLRLYDIAGRCVATKAGFCSTVGEQDVTIGCSHVPPGIYYLHASDLLAQRCWRIILK